MAHWRTKAAISQKRVKMEEKSLWSAYRKSSILFQNITIPDRLRPSIPQDWGSPSPKLQLLLNLSLSACLSCLLLANKRVHKRVKPSSFKKFRDKRAWVYPGTPQFLGTPIISGTGKATDFKFGRYNDRVYVNKSPLQPSGTLAISVVRESCTFSGHPYTARIARLSLRQHGFSCMSAE